jgi:tRNA A-37 threonylcarbamoyl transferase component Bud32
MPFNFDESNKLLINKCSSNCVLCDIEGIEPNEVCFAGFSKGHNKGLRYGNHFYLERLAKSWDGNNHDFHVSVIREQVVRSGKILQKLANIKHPNLLRIITMCDCSIVVEFINGKLLNTKKEQWYIGPHSYKTDYTDTCSKAQLINVFKKIGKLLLVLHKNGICHTDTTDHNIMICENTDEPILIDLIGAMPYTNKLKMLDEYIYLNHLVIPMAARKGIEIPKQILEFDINPSNSVIEELVFHFEKYK